MNIKYSLLAILAGLAAVPSLDSFSAPAPTPTPVPPSHARYEVTVTNLTRGQIFSPPVVAAHSSRMTPIWTLGSKASPELANVAEDALNPILIGKLKKSPFVRGIAEVKGKNGVILPGETAKVVLTTRGPADRFSMAGMLVITNDAFFGANGAPLPRRGSHTLMSPAYDAGSEANTESCAHIPGPPCGNAMVRVTKGAEGYVHIHAGIHGIGDLKPQTYDWRNGVARISIRRVR